MIPRTKNYPPQFASSGFAVSGEEFRRLWKRQNLLSRFDWLQDAAN